MIESRLTLLIIQFILFLSSFKCNVIFINFGVELTVFSILILN